MDVRIGRAAWLAIVAAAQLAGCSCEHRRSPRSTGLDDDYPGHPSAGEPVPRCESPNDHGDSDGYDAADLSLDDVFRRLRDAGAPSPDR